MFYPYLNESPDRICVNPDSKNLGSAHGEYTLTGYLCAEDYDTVGFWGSEDALAFGLLKPNHPAFNDRHPDHRYWNRVLGHKKPGDFWLSELKGDSLRKTHQTGRRFYDLAGRIWLDKKVISFWEYPTQDKIISFLNSLFEEINKTFGNVLNDTNPNNYWIEIITELGDPNAENKLKQEGDELWEGKVKTKYIKVPNYLKLDKIIQPTEKQISTPHLEKDPEKRKEMLKGYKGGSYKTAWDAKDNIRYRQAKQTSESFYPLLNENPNAIIKRKIWDIKKDVDFRPGGFDVVGWSQEDENIPFAYYDGNLITGEYEETHHDLAKKAGHQIPAYGSGRGDYAGRIFPTEKVITFWDFPENKEKLIKIIKDLEGKTNLDIENDSEWRIEIPRAKLEKPEISGWKNIRDLSLSTLLIYYVPIEDYEGGYDKNYGYESPHLEKNPEKRKQMLKGYKGGSYKTAWDAKDNIKMRQAKQTSESFYPLLKESPDAFRYGEKFYDFEAPGAFPFGYEDGKLIVGKEQSTHDLMPKKSKPEDGRARFYYDYSGRIYTEQKVLTFWTYPENINKLRDICRDLEQYLDIKILDVPGWKIEMAKRVEYEKDGNLRKRTIRELIPLNRYKSPGEWSEEEKNVQHIISPLQKNKQSGPGKYPGGSTKTAWGTPHDIRHQQYTKIGDSKEEDNFYPHLND